jgi:hypothetical protein
MPLSPPTAIPAPPLLPPTLVFITTSLLLRSYVRNYGPTPFASQVIKLHNCIYSLLSLLFFLTLVASLSPFPSHNVNADNKDTLLRNLYHASKFYEYLDILLYTAAGGEVGLQFAFHHLTVCSLFSRIKLLS